MLESVFDRLSISISEGTPVCLVTIVDGPGMGNKLLIHSAEEVAGTLGNGDLDRVVIRDALGELAAGVSGVRHYGDCGEARQSEVSVFIETYAPPPQLLIFGAVDFTAALASVAKVIGYRVTVCDARPVFATNRRFPDADEVVVDWPHRLLERIGSSLTERDAIAILTHDPKFDVPAAIEALKTEAGYIGAMGSRRTTADRNSRLADEGVSPEELDRIFAPIGLDLGARTPEETAVSICSEIIALRGNRPAPSLSKSKGSIHRT